MGYFVNMDKNGETELESSLKTILHAVDHGHLEMGEIHISHLEEYEHMCKSNPPNPEL